MHNKLKSTALVMLLLMLLAFASSGCYYYIDPSQQQTAQQGDIIEDLFTVLPEDATTPAQSDSTAEPTASPTADPTDAPTAAPTAEPTTVPAAAPTECPVREDGQYNTKDDVALYIHLYGHLPSNYIKKSEAQALGWSGGSLEPYAPGCSIGGDYFGNYEGLLPKASGRSYHECDIDTKGKSSRGAKRIVFSNDGLIYYSDDHYDSFTLLYGGD